MGRGGVGDGGVGGGKVLLFGVASLPGRGGEGFCQTKFFFFFFFFPFFFP